MLIPTAAYGRTRAIHALVPTCSDMMTWSEEEMVLWLKHVKFEDAVTALDGYSGEDLAEMPQQDVERYMPPAPHGGKLYRLVQRQQKSSGAGGR